MKSSGASTMSASRMRDAYGVVRLRVQHLQQEPLRDAVQQHERCEPADRVHDVPARDLDRSPESARQALGPSRIAAGTTNPKSASQTTAANENQGSRNAAGRNTSEPTPIAVNHARRAGARPETRALAQAYEAAKNGAASANTTIDVAVS